MYKYTMRVLLRARSYPFGTGIGGKEQWGFLRGKTVCGGRG